jgi:hypothetical protein
MGFTEELKALADRSIKLKGVLQTEEAVKHSLLMPFLNLLGYNVWDPHEIVPEYIADLGTKKGEKVDYVILNNGDPHILIEVKGPDSKVEEHKNQLYRYFNSLSKTKFAILTNGLVYQFFSDLDEPNIMDMNPFLTVDFENLKDQVIIELEKFHKKNYNIELILSTANELKYTNQIKEYLAKQFKDPDEDFMKTILRNVYNGKLMSSTMLRFEPIIKKSVYIFITELINEKIKAALMESEKTEKAIQPQIQELTKEVEKEDRKIITTEEELEAFVTIKILLKDILTGDNKITYKDTASYFIVMINDNNKNWLCRLRLGSKKKSIEFKDGEYIEIETIQDIEKYKDKFVSMASMLVIPIE